MENISLFAWGFLGMAQALILPGFCITSTIIPWNRLQRILFAIPLSLLVNYYLVCILFFFGGYGRVSLLAVIALELAWIVRCSRKSRATSISYPPVSGVVDFVFLVIGLAALIKYSQAWSRGFGDIFQMWDAIVSWSEWAKNWYSGVFPESGMYPNGLPIIYSIPYAILQRVDVETFSRASSGIFFLGAIAALIELGFRRVELRRTMWLLAYVYPAVQATFLHSHWQSGYADIPLASFLIFAFCISFFDTKNMPWLFGLVAGAAPLVKQPGLLFTVVSPLLATGWQKWKELRTIWPKIFIAAGLASAPWYIFIVTRIYGLQKDTNNVGTLANMVPGGLAERWGFTLKLLMSYSSVTFLVFAVVMIIVGMVVSRLALRWIAFLGLPYFFIWGTIFGYDIRNLSMSLFPFALGISAGGVFFVEKLEAWLAPALPVKLSLPRALRHHRILPFSVMALTVFLTVIAFAKPIGKWRTYGGMLGWEKEQRIDLGDFPRANRVLYGLIHCPSLEKVAFYSNAAWLTYTPIREFHPFVKWKSCESVFDKYASGEMAYAALSADSCPSLSAKIKGVVTPIYAEEGLIYIFALNKSLPAACPESK